MASAVSFHAFSCLLVAHMDTWATS